MAKCNQLTPLPFKGLTQKTARRRLAIDVTLFGRSKHIRINYKPSSLRSVAINSL